MRDQALNADDIFASRKIRGGRVGRCRELIYRHACIEPKIKTTMHWQVQDNNLELNKLMNLHIVRYSRGTCV